MKRLLEFCYRYKSYYKKRGMDTPILNALIFKNMRAIVGGRIRLLLSGGAPLSPDTHDYVRNALCLPLVQGYGLTESCACGTIMDRYVFVYYYFLFYFYVKLIFFFYINSDEWSVKGAGPPLQGVQVKLINWDEGNYTVDDKPNPRGNVI